MIDDVETPVPGSFLRQTFRYRHHQLAGDLAAHRGAAQRGGRPLAIAVTGSSGLIGSNLCAYLSTGGHRVIRLVRRAPRGPFERSWDPGRPDPRVSGGHRRRRASRRGIHRRPLHRRPQAAGARQPGRPHLGVGPCHGRSAGWTEDPALRLGHWLLRERTRRRAADGGQHAGLGVSGGTGRGLGAGSAARRRRGRASGARADGDRPVRTWREPQAPPPSLLAWPRRTARSGIAMGVMDRSRRPARCLRACARRRRARGPAERGRALCRHQR